MHDLDRLDSYISDNKRARKVLVSLPKSIKYKCGVSQGPLLFILYTNDLIDYLGDSRIGIHADNTDLFYASESLIDLAMTSYIDVNIVGQWLTAYGLNSNTRNPEFRIFVTDEKPHLGDSREKKRQIN